MTYDQAAETTEAVDEYRRWGDELPPVGTLRDIFEPLDADNRGRLSTLLVKSHVCIDLARAEPQHAKRWLDSSETALDEIEQTGAAFRAQAEALTSNVLPYVTRAALGRVDLPNWRLAMESQPITNNYSFLLEKAEAALSLAALEAEDATHGRISALIEAVPRILGARKGEEEGWGEGSHSYVKRAAYQVSAGDIIRTGMRAFVWTWVRKCFFTPQLNWPFLPNRAAIRAENPKPTGPQAYCLSRPPDSGLRILLF